MWERDGNEGKNKGSHWETGKREKGRVRAEVKDGEKTNVFFASRFVCKQNQAKHIYYH